MSQREVFVSSEGLAHWSNQVRGWELLDVGKGNVVCHGLAIDVVKVHCNFVPLVRERVVAPGSWHVQASHASRIRRLWSRNRPCQSDDSLFFSGWMRLTSYVVLDPVQPWRRGAGPD